KRSAGSEQRFQRCLQQARSMGQIEHCEAPANVERLPIALAQARSWNSNLLRFAGTTGSSKHCTDLRQRYQLPGKLRADVAPDSTRSLQLPAKFFSRDVFGSRLFTGF